MDTKQLLTMITLSQTLNYQKAAEQLLAAGDYQDAAQKFADVATTLGNAALEAGDNQTAIG